MGKALEMASGIQRNPNPKRGKAKSKRKKEAVGDSGNKAKGVSYLRLYALCSPSLLYSKLQFIFLL
jgi:hypothetical protein